MKKLFNRKKMDWMILALVAILSILGVVMVYSASIPTALIQKDGDLYFFISRHIQFLFVGFFLFYLASRIHYRIYEKFSVFLYVASIVLVLLTLFSPLGKEVNGSKRFLEIAGQRLMPVEFVKMGAILYYAKYLSNCEFKSFVKETLPALGMIAVTAGLILLQDDLSSTLTVAATMFVMLVCAGLKWRDFFLSVTVGGLAVAGVFYRAYKKESYQWKRIDAWLHPDQYGGTLNYQVKQSLYAYAHGSLTGVGLGEGIQKYYYLPYPYNDFIFSVLAEELGFIGAIGTIFIYGILIWTGLRIAMRTQNRYGALLAVGITALYAFQTIIHIGVGIGLLPNTGVVLPLISYGGTALLTFLSMAGILVSVSISE